MMITIDKQVHIEQMLDLIVKKVLEEDKKGVVKSIIATGSFGRGEPTFTIVDGQLHLTSDVEISLVYSHMKEKRILLDLMSKVESQFRETVELMPFQERRLLLAQNHNYAIIEPRKKTLFTYDVFNGSYTLWGQEYLKRKNIKLSDVDKYEAKRIVANRIGELVHNFDRDEDISAEEYVMIWKGKVILAIVSAWLLLHEQYESSYHKQYEIIKKSFERVEATLGSGFFLEYEKVFSYLRDAGEPYEVSDANLRHYVKQINVLFNERHLMKSKVNCFSKKIRGWIKYIKSGAHYGIEYENRILQSLLDDYISGSSHIKDSAETWSKVIYY